MLARRFARRGQIASADLIMYLISGGLLLMFLPLSLSQMLGREPEEIFTQITLFAMVVVFTSGAVSFIIGLGAGLTRGLSSLARWARDRRMPRSKPVEEPPPSLA